MDRDKLIAQMQMKKEELQKLVMLPESSVFDPEVLRISRELDLLIMELGKST